VVWGDGLLYNQALWANHVVWGDSTAPWSGSMAVDPNHVVWGDVAAWANHIVWGDAMLGLTDGTHVVWGDHIVWGDHVVWGDSLGNVLWKPLDDGHVVRGKTKDLVGEVTDLVF
jgi:hypothetical protein